MPVFCLNWTIVMFVCEILSDHYLMLAISSRLLVNAKKSQYIAPILASLRWLPVDFRIKYMALLCF